MHCVSIMPALLFPRLHTTVLVCVYQSRMLTGETEKKHSHCVSLPPEKKKKSALVIRKFCKTQALCTFCLNRRAWRTELLQMLNRLHIKNDDAYRNLEIIPEFSRLHPLEKKKIGSSYV